MAFVWCIAAVAVASGLAMTLGSAALAATTASVIGGLLLLIFIDFFVSRHLARVEAAPPDVSGKVAIVTGGTTGVGWFVAKNLAVGGAHVILASRDDSLSQKCVLPALFGTHCIQATWNWTV